MPSFFKVAKYSKKNTPLKYDAQRREKRIEGKKNNNSVGL